MQETRPLGAGMIVQDNRIGRTSHHAHAVWRVEPILGRSGEPFDVPRAILTHAGLPLPRPNAGQGAAFLPTRRKAS